MNRDMPLLREWLDRNASEVKELDAPETRFSGSFVEGASLLQRSNQPFT